MASGMGSYPGRGPEAADAGGGMRGGMVNGMGGMQPGMQPGMQAGMQGGMQGGMQPGMQGGMYNRSMGVPMGPHSSNPYQMHMAPHGGAYVADGGMGGAYVSGGAGGLNPYSQQFMPSQYSYSEPQQQFMVAGVDAPPTDEEQEWLEKQMNQNEDKMESADKIAATAYNPAEQAFAEGQGATAAAGAPSEGDYGDVMKMIEENRRRNEAKRAAQSARNAEIIAAYEARMHGGQHG
mmetsp:Transcript_36636/g.85565  ORF Transcript_36636/g.85565 Transcript_36636/m.85565 type:complete len:235 (-) Transcript_36636:349-1053(-)